MMNKEALMRDAEKMANFEKLQKNSFQNRIPYSEMQVKDSNVNVGKSSFDKKKLLEEYDVLKVFDQMNRDTFNVSQNIVKVINKDSLQAVDFWDKLDRMFKTKIKELTNFNEVDTERVLKGLEDIVSNQKIYDGHFIIRDLFLEIYSSSDMLKKKYGLNIELFSSLPVDDNELTAEAKDYLSSVVDVGNLTQVIGLDGVYREPTVPEKTLNKLYGNITKLIIIEYWKDFQKDFNKTYGVVFNKFKFKLDKNLYEIDNFISVDSFFKYIEYFLLSLWSKFDLDEKDDILYRNDGPDAPGGPEGPDAPGGPGGPGAPGDTYDTDDTDDTDDEPPVFSTTSRPLIRQASTRPNTAQYHFSQPGHTPVDDDGEFFQSDAKPLLRRRSLVNTEKELVHEAVQDIRDQTNQAYEMDSLQNRQSRHVRPVNPTGVEFKGFSDNVKYVKVKEPAYKEQVAIESYINRHVAEDGRQYFNQAPIVDNENNTIYRPFKTVNRHEDFNQFVDSKTIKQMKSLDFYRNVNVVGPREKRKEKRDARKREADEIVNMAFEDENIKPIIKKEKKKIFTEDELEELFKQHDNDRKIELEQVELEEEQPLTRKQGKLKKKKLAKKDTKGSGLIKSKEMLEVGNFKLDLGKLQDEKIIRLVHKSNKSVAGFPNKKVSPTFVKIVLEMIESGKMKQTDFNKLDEDDKTKFNKFCEILSLSEKVGLGVNHDDLKKRLLIIEGQIEADNDNKALIREADHILKQMTKEGLISKTEKGLHLQQLKDVQKQQSSKK